MPRPSDSLNSAQYMAHIISIQNRYARNSPYLGGVRDFFRRTGRITPRQREVCNSILDRWKSRYAERDSRRQQDGPAFRRRFLSIIDFMYQARNRGLNYPKITLIVEGKTYQFRLNGDRSRNPGHISITDGQPYGENIYYGRLDPEGAWFPSRRAGDRLVNLLFDFDQAPSEFTTNYGKKTGSCCFCARELTTEESLHAGYGPVCAGHYGLPWGATSDELQPAVDG